MRPALGVVPALAVWLATISHANAARLDGNTLLEICERDRAACMLFVIGAVDAAEVTLETLGRRQIACPAANVTNAQLAEVVLSYLLDHPEIRHLSAASTALAGIGTAFPCPAISN